MTKHIAEPPLAMLKLEVYNITIQQSYLHDRLSRLISQELAEKAGLSVQSSSTNVGLRYSRWSGFRIPDHRLSLLSLHVPWSLPPVFSISMMHQFLATPLKFINATSTVRTSSLWFPSRSLLRCGLLYSTVAAAVSEWRR